VTRKNNVNRRNLTQTRKRILNAAAREFAEHGLSGARVDAIAAKAKVNKAMIYYIFGGKEDLHLAVLEALFDEKTKNLDRRVATADVSPAALLEMLKDYYQTFLDRRDYARILANDIVTGGNSLRRLKKKRPDLFAVFDTITGMIGTSIERGMIREIDEDKGLILLIVIVSSLTCLMPHMDLARPKGSAAHQALSNPGQWQAFLAQILERILQPPPA